ncbi:MAG TPA: glycosyltransferase [Chitinispirillaceae bacterium]|nr:glycosyltransferase [Chitinispirillaceae bacterium]
MPERTDVFQFRGKDIYYNLLPANNNPQTERSVEVPIAIDFLKQQPPTGRLLEIGNVLSCYQDLLPTGFGIESRTIVDKFEKNEGVQNIDLMELDSNNKYSTIVCLSTVEHVGQSVDPKNDYGEKLEGKSDIDAPLKAIAKIFSLLEEGGKAFITAPYGKFIDGGWYIQFDWEYLNKLYEVYGIPRVCVKSYCLRISDSSPRNSSRRVWHEVSPSEDINVMYNNPFPCANAIIVLEMEKLPGDSHLFSGPPVSSYMLATNRLCVESDFYEDYHRYWTSKLRIPSTLNRKYWDWAIICQALFERSVLKEGSKGLGFAVGNEPLASAFASMGCEVVATDQSPDNPNAEQYWGITDQLCYEKTALNRRGICDSDQFDRLVSFRRADMTNIPGDLKKEQFDFIWSSCSFEHVGSIERGVAFVIESLRCLKPGGLAVHTTEYNCNSNEATLVNDSLAFYRRKDIEWLIKELETLGHSVEPFALNIGNSLLDMSPMHPPHDHKRPHLKVEIAGHIATSLLLVIHKSAEPMRDSKKGAYAESAKKPGLILDISLLGYGFLDKRNRTGVSRVAENLFTGITNSDQFNLQLSATHSVEAAAGLQGYLRLLQLQNSGGSIHSDFSNTIQSKFIEMYRLLENQLSPNKNRFTYPAEALSCYQTFALLCQTMQSFFRHPSMIPMDELKSADLFHATYYNIPDQVRVNPRIEKFLTVYDLIPILLPEFFVGNNSDVVRVKRMVKDLHDDDNILCISESTRNDLLNMVNIDHSRVTVTPLAADPLIFYPKTNQDEILSVRAKYKIPDGPYFLSVSTIEPRKNLSFVVRGFGKLLMQEKIGDLNLVLTGALGNNHQQVIDEARKLGISANRIIFTGYIDDSDFAALYSGALSFIFMSLYEGFGLPPLEAMQCGIPVITSNTSSLPEVVGGAGVMLDPRDEQSFCESLLSMYSSPSLRAELSAKAITQSKIFTWKRFTNETINAYKRALGMS